MLAGDGPSTTPDGDPDRAAMNQEFQCRLRALRARQSEEMRAVWDLLVEKASVPAIAQQLGLTKRQARRRVEHLKQLAHEELGRYWPGVP